MRLGRSEKIMDDGRGFRYTLLQCILRETPFTLFLSHESKFMKSLYYNVKKVQWECPSMRTAIIFLVFFIYIVIINSRLPLDFLRLIQKNKIVFINYISYYVIYYNRLFFSYNVSKSIFKCYRFVIIKSFLKVI